MKKNLHLSPLISGALLLNLLFIPLFGQAEEKAVSAKDFSQAVDELLPMKGEQAAKSEVTSGEKTTSEEETPTGEKKEQETVPGPRFLGYERGFHEDVLALQVLLDRRHLSCNCVDGHWGPHTEIAYMTWQLLNGKEADGIPTAEALEELGGMTNQIFQVYTVTQEDLDALVNIPTDWEGKAQLKRMGYRNILEMLAEKGHTSIRAVQRLNPNLGFWPNPPAGTRIVLPNCELKGKRRRLPIADSMRISLSRREITLFDNDGKLIALFPCSIARSKSQRPEGELLVKNTADNPTYLYDPKLFNPNTSKTAKLIIPPGPNNPVGSAWVGLTKQGYGIHGTPEPERIGTAASHGCFRLSNWNAKKLIHMIYIQMPMSVEE